MKNWYSFPKNLRLLAILFGAFSWPTSSFALDEIKFNTTIGQQYGIADLDWFKLSSTPDDSGVYATQECEDNSGATVGQKIWRGPINSYVWGQFGTADTGGYPARAGSVWYAVQLRSGKTYIKVRYTKYSPSIVPVEIFANSVKQTEFLPVDQGSWDAAATTNWIEILDRPNNPPTSISLSNARIAENSGAGAVVGALSASDPDAGDSITLTLTDSAGGRFQIANGQLVETASLDYESATSYQVVVRATDSGGLYKESSFTIDVTDVFEYVNHPPTSISLTNTRIAENSRAGAVVGTLSASDPDAGDSITLTLTDNAGGRFQIANGQLIETTSLDYESATSYQVGVRATDSGGLYTESSFTIAVDNVNEAPSSISLSNARITENSGAGVVVGTLSTSDPDAGDSTTLTLTDSAGGRFQISNGTQLLGTLLLDTKIAKSYRVVLKAEDRGGLSVAKSFTVTVDVSKSEYQSVIEDFTDIVTPNDFGYNDFSGNVGFAGSPEFGRVELSADSGNPHLQLDWDFSSACDTCTPFAAVFFSLFGLTDALSTFNGIDTAKVPYPEHSLDLDAIDGVFRPTQKRAVQSIGFELSYSGNEDLKLKVELADSASRKKSIRFPIVNSSTSKVRYYWDFRGDVHNDDNMDTHTAKVLSFVVERAHDFDKIRNPDSGVLQVHKVWLNLSEPEAEPQTDTELLELVERRTCQYFFDWASRKPETRGIPQDRSTFANLLTVGGVGFGLPAYVITSDRGWVNRDTAAALTLSVLRALNNPGAFGPEAVGKIGFKGWFYHFLNTDGRRKLNYDDKETPEDESHNTVELSSIDTGLSIMGILVAQSYFDRQTPVEEEIRRIAQEIYDRVEWDFLLDPRTNQFRLGWKPREAYQDPNFAVGDGNNLGAYSGNSVYSGTLDFYTDEALILVLLAAGAQSHRLPESVIDALYCSLKFDSRDGLVRTYPGSLFTFQFLGAFLDTKTPWVGCQGNDEISWFENSRKAIDRAMAYTAESSGRFASYDYDGWGITACENAADAYHAYGVPTIAVDSPLYEDGTVTYYGAVSAIGFGADYYDRVVSVLRSAWRRNHWHTRFGLPDAYNLEISGVDRLNRLDRTPYRTNGEWTQRALFAIDQGPMLLHLENSQTQLIWKLTAANPNIQRALAVLTPRPAMTIDDATVVEGQAGLGAVFTVSLSETSKQAIAATYQSVDGTAIAGTDYVASSGVLVFAPGETRKTITVNIKDDLLDEADETFGVNLSAVTNATLGDGQGVGTINDDDRLPALSIGDVSVVEGNAGANNAVFLVNLSAPSGQMVEVSYVTVNGDATAGSDYVESNGVLNYAPGETSKTITVAILPDTLVEHNETFVVLLRSPVNAILAGDHGTGRIINDDAGGHVTPALMIDDAVVSESTVSAVFRVSLSSVSDQTVTVSYSTHNGTATAGTDYVESSGTLNFAPRDTSKTITIGIMGDAQIEDNEIFTVILSSPTNAVLADGQAEGKIANDDQPDPQTPAITIDDATVMEREDGSTSAVFAVRLSSASDQTVTVSYRIHNGTATAGTDFVASSGVLSFAPGETGKSITVAIKMDKRVEANETFGITLSSPVNGAIADGQAEGIIIDATLPPKCLGDLDNSRTVDFADFFLFADQFGKTSGFEPGADLDGNGEVGFADFFIFSDAFGKKCADR